MAQARAIHLVLAVYTAGFLLYWPGALLISDEAAYLGSAWAFAHGRTTVEVRPPSVRLLTWNCASA